MIRSLIRPACLAACLATLAGPSPAPAAVTDHPLHGEPAPAFELPSVGGPPVRLADFAGSYLVVHFGTSW